MALNRLLLCILFQQYLTAFPDDIDLGEVSAMCIARYFMIVHSSILYVQVSSYPHCLPNVSIGRV